MSQGIPSAGLLENLRFNASVVVPNALQGIFRRRRPAVLVATRAGVDGQAIGLLEGMARAYDGGPVWIRVIRDRALLMLDPEDTAKVLDGSPAPYASDPPAKRDGMVAFQPDALTISRGEAWENRRRFAEAVLETTDPPHHLNGRFEGICREETERMLTGPVAVAGGTIDWDAFNETIQRITRRIVLGDGAAADTGLTEILREMMSEGNGMPGTESQRLPEFGQRLSAHLDRAEEGSLASLFANAPSDASTKVARQVTHWIFALGDTLAINAFRALAVLASHDVHRQRAAADAGGDYLNACLHEAMRLWPTTPMLSRVTTDETEWLGETVPARTQILIVNTFAHRNRDRLDYADRFAPEEWTEGEAASDPAFNHFSRGPQGCPGAALALLVGRTVIGELLHNHAIAPVSPKLDPGKPLPHMVDFFGIRVRVS